MDLMCCLYCSAVFGDQIDNNFGNNMIIWGIRSGRVRCYRWIKCNSASIFGFFFLYFSIHASYQLSFKLSLRILALTRRATNSEQSNSRKTILPTICLTNITNSCHSHLSLTPNTGSLGVFWLLSGNAWGGEW